MFKVLKNQDGFSGLIGLIVAIVVIGIMTAMYLPTQTAKNEYHQARYIAGVTKTIENAENAYMAKNGSFADLVMLSQNGYLSPQFLQSLQPANNPGGPYPQPNWITLELAKQTVNLCIDNNGGCPDNPSGNNYFIGLYSIPVNYANYIEHELPGSGIGSQGGGLEYVAYSAPVPSAPPVASANYANSAGTANYANTAGYSNTSGLPSWSKAVLPALQEISCPNNNYDWCYNNTNNYYSYSKNCSGGCSGGGSSGFDIMFSPGQNIYFPNYSYNIHCGGSGGSGYFQTDSCQTKITGVIAGP